MAINVGDVVYMDYGEAPQCVHSRLVLAEVDASTHEFVILTPDLDQYIEILHASNPDVRSFHRGGAAGGLPRGVPAASIYGFAPMTARDYSGHLRAGRREADAERRRRGLGAMDPAPAAGGAADPAGAGVGDVAGPPAGDAGLWVLAEMVGGHKIGERVAVPDGMVQEAGWGLCSMSDDKGVTRPCLVRRLREDEIPKFCEERIALARSSIALEGDDFAAAEDARTIEIRYGLNGERLRNFKETISELVEVDFNDFPFEPRTALQYVKAVASVAESCYAQHLSWVAQSKIPEGDRAIHEDEVLSRVLDAAVTYDGLNVANLASFELIVRRKQLLAEAHSYNPSAPSYDGADHFMGTTFRPGGGIVIPVLTEFVSKRMQQESQILKERRKLSEAKGKGRTGKPSPKGAGDGAPKGEVKK